MTKFNIVYLPLDERPCNYHFAQRIAMGTEVHLRKPSPEVLGDKKIPADYDKVRKYLLDNATTANAYIVSLDMLLYGGIVPSRLHQLDEDELTARLDVLDEIKRINPAVKIYAFQLIMRCPCYSSSDEEPDYYEYCGRGIFLTGQVKHKLELGLVTQDEAQELLGQYAEKIGDNLIDFEQRRKVNRNMLVKAVKKLHHAIDFLVIPQDDSAPYGYTSMDRELIKKQLAENHLEEVAMYPGADEVGMTLLARAVCEYKKVSPRMHCVYCHEKSPYIIPLYEDRPLKDTLPFQIGTAGCRFADGKEDADIMLYLNYPSQQPVDESSLPSVGYGERDLVTFCNKMVEDIKNGKIVALADGAYCNGGDLELFEHVGADDPDSLRLEVYLYLRCGIPLNGGEYRREHLFADFDGEHAVVEGVVAEDVGEETRHHGTESRAGDGPCRMFTARTAAEVLACDEDPAAVAWRVEHEVGLGVAVCVVTPVAEEILAEAIACGGLEESCRNDLVGVDVLYRQGYGRRSECSEFVSHGSFMCGVT